MHAITIGFGCFLCMCILAVLAERNIPENGPDLEVVIPRIEDQKLQKKGWNSLSGMWGKRDWNGLSGMWGKRNWNNPSETVNKRGWNDLSGMWGKRDWNDLSGMWGKRDWNDLSGMWGKRDWNNLSGMWGKRDWNNLSGMWGKRGWNNLSGMWGKRGTYTDSLNRIWPIPPVEASSNMWEISGMQGPLKSRRQESTGKEISEE
ncbi:prothoracicostatic peptide-like [Limulus polyphemus]|uniref:Prothoracicostatic peptide-like n=1 Tax=Limulus polyphemus TaxID=6850 RepID=A0ABM1S915_LIMPO|nr:prothoracicostatic peptide-like [Limulus polyphemus]XP_022240120.1 prothoracicostatic peptide-like [Limulus polyphemus]